MQWFETQNFDVFSKWMSKTFLNDKRFYENNTDIDYSYHIPHEGALIDFM